MEIPDTAIVTRFDTTALRSLLVGRFRADGPNFVAVRTERQISTGDASPHMAILPPSEDHPDSPYLCAPEFGSTKGLDLGTDWSVDVEIDGNTPAFDTTAAGTILIRSTAQFFIRMYRGPYLDLGSGILVRELPNHNIVVTWSGFRICLPQPGVDGPGAEVYRWPPTQPPADCRGA